MAPKCFGSLSLLALAGTALSKAFMPEPTITDPAVMRDGVSPVPTDGPKHELVKRDTAFYDTCGFISSTRTMSCNALNTCAFVTSGIYSLQGCCAGFSGLTDCAFPTTCYDYAAYTASSCDTNCQLNQLNVVCTDSFEPSCRYYEFPNGASGFGCNTIGGTVTVTSVSGTITALVPTAAAAQFNAVTSVYNPYSYSYSPYSYPTYTAGGTGGTYYGTTYGLGAAATTLATGAIAGIAIFGIGYGCWYLAAAVVIFMMCKRSKRLTAAWDQPGGANYRGVEGSNVVGVYAVAPAVQAVPTPTMSPAPQQAGYFAAPADQNKGVSPQQQTVSPVHGPGSPAPSYAGANVGQYQYNGQPAQPYVYPAQQQYVEAPAPVHQPQQPQQHQPDNEVSELM
jgi:hypothetical protein